MGRSGKSVYGTESDPINCSFFLRVGACRHGSCCPKKHAFPTFGNTLMIHHYWIPPKKLYSRERELKKHYDRFCEDLLEEFLKYGNVMDFQALKNIGDHNIGNTFIKYADEDEAAEALKHINGRFYAGRKIKVNFSPITDFDNARCRDYQTQSCTRGNFCNFAHFMRNPRWTANHLNQMSAQERLRRKTRKLREKRTRDGWPEFPVGGSTAQREKCLTKWNELLSQKREREGLKPPPGLEHLYGIKKEMDVQPQADGLQLFRPNIDA